jgi:uncharacterized BrkB/YihY/UPF0761 family membrane protein
VNPIERVVRVVDRAQQRSRVAGFAFSVVKKFGDDRGPSLAALLAYYGFLSLFPALLIITTVVGFIGNDRVADSVVGSLLGGLPVFGEQIGEQATDPLQGNMFALTAGVLFLLYGALGVAQAGQHAMAEVWNVPGVVRPGFFPRLVRSLAFVLLMACGIAVIAAVSTAGTLGDVGLLSRVGSLLVQAGLTVGLYLAAFRVLTPKSIATRCLFPGAVAGGVGYSILLLLWPRSIMQPPLTRADEQVLSDIALQGERRPEQQVAVEFDEEATSS